MLKSILKSALVGMLLLVPLAAQAAMSDDDVKKQMIDESIKGYSGACACPYSKASNGSNCGGRSAYSKPSGKTPLCYPKDINDNALGAYRKAHGL